LLIIDDDVNPGLRGRVEVNDEDRGEASRHFPSLVATAKGDGTIVESDCTAQASSHKTWGSSQNGLSRVCEPARMANPKLVAEKRRKEEEAKDRHRRSEELRLRSNVAAEHTSPGTSELAKTGWRRPVGETANANPARYAAALIARATVHPSDLARLEKKLIKFLSDDARPSLSLRPMASESLRRLVEEYCKHWRVRTVAPDRGVLEAARGEGVEDVRIDVDKMEDTCAPYPLLSDAAKHPVLGVTVGFKKKKKGKKYKAFELAI